MNYTKPTREDGCWDVEQETLSDDEHDPEYGPVEVFALMRDLMREKHDGLQRRRPICEVASPDLAPDGVSQCAGNISLIVTAPRMYASLQRAAEVLRFMLEREKDERAHGIHRELICHVADAEATLRQVERVAEQLLAGEHVA